MDFNRWLKTQRYRDDLVGDLAKDFISTGDSSIKESFRRYTPCEGALEAYREAKVEYRAAKAAGDLRGFVMCA